MTKDVVVHRGAQACVNRRDREGGTVVEKKRVGEGGGGKECVSLVHTCRWVSGGVC